MPNKTFKAKGIKSESTVPIYRPDGTGRDLFRMDYLERIPATGYLYVENRRDPIEKKRIVDVSVTGTATPLPSFIPNGTGRDLFHQCNPNPVVARTGVTFRYSSHAPNYSKKGVGVTRTNRIAPKYQPNGSGRDLFFGNLSVTTRATMRHESPKKAPRARSSTLPRFRPIGSGRDTFQSSAFDDDDNNSTTSVLSLRSYSPNPKLQGFAYGNESIVMHSRSPQKQALKKYLSRQGTRISSAEQRGSMTRLATSPSRRDLSPTGEALPVTYAPRGFRETRIDSPLELSPIRQLRPQSSMI